MSPREPGHQLAEVLLLVLPIFRGERHDRLRRVGGGEGVEFILGLIGSRIKDREQALARREDEGFHVRLTVRGQGLGDL